jgi:hypothetical protein
MWYSHFSRHLFYWTERADCVAVKLDNLVNQSAQEYVETIYKRYEKTGNKDDIQDAIVDAARLQKSIHRYEAEILQLAGLGVEWKHASDISKRVGDVVKWLEELLLLAMVDAKDLIYSHSRNTLLYQSN